MKILVTGASGFIGSYIVEEALRQGMETWAAVRPTSSRKYLQDERIHFINLNLSSEEELEKELAPHEFDYIVHAAGATKCLHAEDFYKVNTEGTKHLVNAILHLGDAYQAICLRQFAQHLRSHPRRAALSGNLREHDAPKPNTAYGKSKLDAERYLDSIGNNFPYIILRPTGVYGPREKDYFLMAQSIKQHVDFAVGFKRQDITFVYVQDVVQAVFLALDHGMNGRKYFLSDGEVYQSAAFSDLIQKELGNPWMLRIKAPIWVLRIVTFFGEYLGRMTGKMSALNNDKYNILKQRNWRCDIEPAMDELGYHPHYPLERGVKLAIKWYKDNGWL